MKTYIRHLFVATAMLGITVFGLANGRLVGTAHAAQLDIATAFGAQSNISVLGLAVLNVPPTPQVIGVGPPQFVVFDSAASVTLLPPLLNTGALVAIAAHDIPPDFPGATIAFAEADGTQLNVAGLITLNAAAVYSAAFIGGDCGGFLFPFGAAGLASANTGGTLNQPINPIVLNTPVPNTELLPGVLNPLGIRIVLNEQAVFTDNKTIAYISVNAVHVTLSGLTLNLLGVATGDIIIAHSEVARIC